MVGCENIFANRHGDFDRDRRGCPYFGFIGNAGLAGTATGDNCDARQGQNGE